MKCQIKYPSVHSKKLTVNCTVDIPKNKWYRVLSTAFSELIGCLLIRVDEATLAFRVNQNPYVVKTLASFEKTELIEADPGTEIHITI